MYRICRLLTIVTSVLLLPLVVYADYNVTSLFNAFKHSARYHNFVNVPIFIGHNVSRDERDELHGLIHGERRYLQYIYDREGETSMFNILRIHIKHDTLSLVLTNGTADPIWLVVDRRLRKMRQTDMIILMEDAAPPVEEDRLFHMLWQLQFKHLFLVHQGRLVGYTPYPRVRSFPMAWVSDQDYLPSRKLDMMGYEISGPLENDLPRIFFVKDEHGKWQAKGFCYQLMMLFFQRLNVTWRLTNPDDERTITSNVNMSLIIQSIAEKKLEITPHPYSGIAEGVGVMSYPLFKSPMCMITPVQNEIPRYMYLFRPLHESCWYLLAFSIPYVAFMLMWISPRLTGDGGARLAQRYSRALLESISQLLFIASVFRIYRPTRRYFFAYTLLAILGFMITSWYSNLLASFFATFLVGKQLNSFRDMLDTGSLFMAKYYEIQMMDGMIDEDIVDDVLGKIIVPVNASVMMSHLLSFNTSYSYPFTIDRWWFYMLQQQYANKPIFRFSDICLGEPNIGIPMRTDSHLEHPLNQFVMDIKMAGLDFYLLQSEFKHALKAGYMKLLSNQLPFKALSLDNLRLAWMLIFAGWVVSVIAFAVERTWWKLKSQQSSAQIN